jgi:hypothetical protein
MSDPGETSEKRNPVARPKYNGLTVYILNRRTENGGEQILQVLLGPEHLSLNELVTAYKGFFNIADAELEANYSGFVNWLKQQCGFMDAIGGVKSFVFKQYWFNNDRPDEVVIEDNGMEFPKISTSIYAQRQMEAEQAKEIALLEAALEECEACS